MSAGLRVAFGSFAIILLSDSIAEIDSLIECSANMSSAITAFDSIIGLYREHKTNLWQLWGEDMSDACSGAELGLALSKTIRVQTDVIKLFGTYSQWLQPANGNLKPNILMSLLLETLLNGVDSEGKERSWRMSIALSDAHLQTSYAALDNKYVTIWHDAWSVIERAALAYDINCYIEPGINLTAWGYTRIRN